MAATILAEFVEDREADDTTTMLVEDGYLGEWVPEVFAEPSRNGLFAMVGDLGECCIILCHNLVNNAN